MNDAESQLHYPLGDRLPEPGRALAVAEGVLWVRMPLPFALDHVNLWLLRDSLDGRAGWTIVDCGIHHEQTRALWEQVFSQELGGLPVLRVIVTHMHPDHIGLAAWLCERWSTPGHPCRLWISAADYHLARVGSSGPSGFGGDGAAALFAAHGLNDPATLEQVRQRSSYYHALVPSLPRAFRRLMDGDTLTIGQRAWSCISGHGHAPEHISLHCESLGLLIGGDMMLPRISTNVSVFDVEPESDPLRQFLHSIDRFRALSEDTLTLPSHGRPFTGLHRRIEQLHAHHRERLSEVQQACRTRPHSAAEVLPLLFKRALDLHQTTFAMGESIAHLHALWFAGRLRRLTGSDGVYRFEAV